MKTKVIFLLFVTGAIAVLAEKEGSEDNRNGNNIQPEVSAKAYFETVQESFKSLEKNISDTMKKLKDSLEKEIETVEKTLKDEQESKTRKAVEGGKGEDKIQECLAEANLNLRDEIKNDMERAVQCFDSATEEAKKSLGDAKNASAKIFGGISGLQRSAHNAYEKINEKVSEFNPTLRNTVEALDAQKKEMDECNKEFMDNLRQVGDGYSTLINQCTTA